MNNTKTESVTGEGNAPRKWKVSFSGHRLGAIGIVDHFSDVEAYGDTEEAAILSLYERYEHISNPQLTETA